MVGWFAAARLTVSLFGKSMDDQPEHERPFLFDLWPTVSFINCPECKCHWSRPSFGTTESYFPALHADAEQAHRKGLLRAHCPCCGILLPEINELIHRGLASASPVKGHPFIGTVSGVQEFLKGCSGCQARLWNYVVSHSNVVLKIDSKHDNTHAFVICMMTRQVLIPSIHWQCSLSLDSTDNPRYWALVDASSGVRIECCAVGIYHQVERLW